MPPDAVQSQAAAQQTYVELIKQLESYSFTYQPYSQGFKASTALLTMVGGVARLAMFLRTAASTSSGKPQNIFNVLTAVMGSVSTNVSVFPKDMTMLERQSLRRYIFSQNKAA